MRLQTSVKMQVFLQYKSRPYDKAIAIYFVYTGKFSMEFVSPVTPSFDVAEFMRESRLTIRHVSQGPPPRVPVPSRAVTGPVREENTSCVFVVRGVHRLGDDPAALLRSYFSQFGPVASLRFACPARSESVFSPSVAFVVMTSPLVVAAILRQEPHLILGRRVLVEPYVTGNEIDSEFTESVLKSLDL